MDSRQVLLEQLSEEELARQLKRWARRYGWHGRHVRYSQGVVEGVHTTRIDGHSDAHGAFDWELVHEEPGHPLLKIELKSAFGYLTKDQRAEQPRLAGCDGVRAFVWRPTDGPEIERVLRSGGLE